MKKIAPVCVLLLVVVLARLWPATPARAGSQPALQTSDDPFGDAIREFHVRMGWQTPLQVRPDQPYFHAFGPLDPSCPGLMLTINMSRNSNVFGWVHDPDASVVEFHGRQAMDWRYIQDADAPTIAKREEKLIWISDEDVLEIDVEKSYWMQKKKSCMDDARYDLYIYANEFYCTLVKHGAIQDLDSFCGGSAPVVSGLAALEGRVTDGYDNPIPLAPVLLHIGGLSLETRTDPGGNYRFTELPVQQPNFNLEENAVMAQVCLSYYDPFYDPLPGTPYPYFSVRYAQDGGSIVCAYTQPFFLAGTSGTQTMNIDLGDPASLQQDQLARLHPDLPAHLADVANNYFHTSQAIALAHLLEQPLDLPVDVVSFVNDSSRSPDACWKGRVSYGSRVWNSCMGITTEYNFLAYNEANSKYTSWNRPVNREWHEFGHHFMADSFGNLLPNRSGTTNHGGYYANPQSNDAWTEGFAEFYAMMVNREVVHNPLFTIYAYGDSSVIDLELNYKAWESEEDAAAGLLLDLVDSGADYQGTRVQNGLRTNPHEDDEPLSMPVKDLWKIIAAGKSNNADSSMGFVFDIEDLYRVLNGAGIGSGDLNANGYADLDEVFIAHGFHADPNGNQMYDPGEAVGLSDHPAYTKTDASGAVTQTYNAMSPRENKSDLPGGYLLFEAADPNGRQIPVESYTVSVEFETPYQAYNYVYDVPANGGEPGRFHLIMPPRAYPSRATILPQGDQILSASPYQLDHHMYWQHQPDPNDTPLARHTFLVEAKQDSLITSTVLLLSAGGLLLAVLFGMVFLVVIVGLVLKKKQVVVTGLVLAAILICFTVAATVVFGGLQWMWGSSAAAPFDPPAGMASPANSPLPAALEPMPEIVTATPEMAQNVPTIIPTEMPHAQEAYAEPTVYNFAACSELCLADLSNRRTTFPERIEKIYLRYDYSRISPGSDYARIWTNGGEEWVRYQCKWDGPENGIFETTLREPAGFRSGEWTMEIHINGRLVTRQSYTVQGNHTYWDPAGTINRCK